MSDTDASARERLLEAAGVCFAQMGYEGTSIRSLTRAARTNLGAITYHFGSKHALYEAVLASRLRPIATTVRRMADRKRGEPPLEQLVRILSAIVDLLRADPERGALLFHEIAGARPPSRITRRIVGGILQELTALVAEGQAAGAIRGGCPALLGMNAFSQPMFIALAERKLGPELPWHEADSQAIAVVVHHMENYVRAALAS